MGGTEGGGVLLFAVPGRGKSSYVLAGPGESLWVLGLCGSWRFLKGTGESCLFLGGSWWAIAGFWWVLAGPTISYGCLWRRCGCDVRASRCIPCGHGRESKGAGCCGVRCAVRPWRVMAQDFCQDDTTTTAWRGWETTRQACVGLGECTVRNVMSNRHQILLPLHH